MLCGGSTQQTVSNARKTGIVLQFLQHFHFPVHREELKDVGPGRVLEGSKGSDIVFIKHRNSFCVEPLYIY